MFMTNNPTLIGYFYTNFGIIIQNDTLATQAGLQSGIDSTIDKIFLFVRDFFQ
jgi:hypothetical protein